MAKFFHFTILLITSTILAGSPPAAMKTFQLGDFPALVKHGSAAARTVCDGGEVVVSGEVVIGFNGASPSYTEVRNE